MICQAAIARCKRMHLGRWQSLWKSLLVTLGLQNRRRLLLRVKEGEGRNLSLCVYAAFSWLEQVENVITVTWRDLWTVMLSWNVFFSILYHNQHILSNIYTFWHQALLAIVLMLCELEDRRNNIRISTWIRQQDTWKFFLSIMTVQKSYTHSDKSLFFTPALNIITYL